MGRPVSRTQNPQLCSEADTLQADHLQEAHIRSAPSSVCFFHIVFLRKVVGENLENKHIFPMLDSKIAPLQHTISEGLRDDTSPETRNSFHPFSVACEKMFTFPSV